MPAKAPDINVENAVLAYLSGEAAQKVARRFGVCGKRLTTILVERGLLRTKEQRYAISGQKGSDTQHGRVNLSDSEVAIRYLAGESEYALAQAMGVSRIAIFTALRKAGVDRRTQSEAARVKSAKMPLRVRPAVLTDRPQPREKSIAEREAAATIWQERAAAGKWARASEAEIRLLNMLRDRGLDVVPQQAVGTYNVDIGTYPIAVEVWGGAFHFSRDHTERFRYLRDRGWNVVIVYSDSKRSPITAGAADYLVAYAESTRRNPPARGEYRVIWGDGNIFAAGSLDDDNIARIVPRKHFLRSGAGD